MRTICIVVSSRSELHLLRKLIEEVHHSAFSELQLVLTGALVSPDFDYGEERVQEWGIPVELRVEILLSSDSPVGAAKTIGLGVTAFADALDLLKPDLLVITGDRYELLAPVTVAFMLGVPVAHIHGGEVTEGALDDCIRHAITKLSSVHLVAAEPYARRVRQLGETPSSVHVVGGLGVDAAARSKCMSRKEVEEALGCNLGRRSILVTFHPVTRDVVPSDEQLDVVLAALDSVAVDRVILTGANSDPEGRRLNDRLKLFAESREFASYIYSLGDPLYTSVIREVSLVVGNSSSGLLEAPALGTPTLNVGTRQNGRLRASSVFDCPAEEPRLTRLLERLLSDEFQATIPFDYQPYGTGGASVAIKEILESVALESLAPKSFIDVPSVGKQQ